MTDFETQRDGNATPRNAVNKAKELAQDAYSDNQTARQYSSIAAGAVYLSTMLVNDKRTQKQVAEASGTSTSTVQTTYLEIFHLADVY